MNDLGDVLCYHDVHPLQRLLSIVTNNMIPSQRWQSSVASLTCFPWFRCRIARIPNDQPAPLTVLRYFVNSRLHPVSPHKSLTSSQLNRILFAAKLIQKSSVSNDPGLGTCLHCRTVLCRVANRRDPLKGKRWSVRIDSSEFGSGAFDG